jgi:peroxiredoxin
MKRRDFIQSALVLGTSLQSALTLATPRQTKTRYELIGTDTFERKLDLAELLGKTVLVSFFTFDCALCTNDLKLMREFYVRNKAKKFAMLGVNLDQNKKDLDEYIETTTMAYPKDQRFPTVWRNASGHKDNFGKILRQPTHFVLDNKHQLLFKREGSFLSDDWDNLWEQLGN